MSARNNEGLGARLGCVGLLALLPLLMAYQAVVFGYVIAKLWGWFVVPTFHLPALSIAQAVGLSLVVSAFRSKVTEAEPENPKTSYTFRVVSYLTFAPAMLLGMGWVIHRYWMVEA